MSERRIGPGMFRELASLRSPLLSGSPREVLETEDTTETKEPREPESPKELNHTKETVETSSPKEVKVSREDISPRRERRSKYRQGYRYQSDIYQKASYFLRIDQIEAIRREADLRGMEISEFVRYIIQDYYERNPLTEERIRLLIEARIAAEIAKIRD